MIISPLKPFRSGDFPRVPQPADFFTSNDYSRAKLGMSAFQVRHATMFGGNGQQH
jgi:hypothetical protein